MVTFSAITTIQYYLVFLVGLCAPKDETLEKLTFVLSLQLDGPTWGSGSILTGEESCLKRNLN